MERSKAALLCVVLAAGIGGCSKNDDCTQKGYAECRRQCEGNSAQACYEVARSLYFGSSDDKGGTAVEQDEAAALAYYERACKGGIDDGCMMLTKAFIGGHGTRVDVNRAMEVAEPLCAKGKGEACKLLVDAAETAGLDSSSARTRAIAALTKECEAHRGKKGSPCWALASSGWVPVDEAMKFAQAACDQGHSDVSLCQNKDKLRTFVSNMHDRAAH